MYIYSFTFWKYTIQAITAITYILITWLSLSTTIYWEHLSIELDLKYEWREARKLIWSKQSSRRYNFDSLSSHVNSRKLCVAILSIQYNVRTFTPIYLWIKYDSCTLLTRECEPSTGYHSIQTSVWVVQLTDAICPTGEHVFKKT